MDGEFGSVPHSVCLMPISGPGSGSVDFTDDLRLAHVLADDADSITQNRFKALDLHVMSKPDLTPVTDADQAVEEAIRRTLSRVRSHLRNITQPRRGAATVPPLQSRRGTIAGLLFGDHNLQPIPLQLIAIGNPVSHIVTCYALVYFGEQDIGFQ